MIPPMEDKLKYLLSVIRRTTTLQKHKAPESSVSGLEVDFAPDSGMDAASVLKSFGYNAEATGETTVFFSDPYDLLLPSDLIGEKPSEVFMKNIHIIRKTGSTNRVLSSMAGAGAPHGTVVIAEEQTAGRGRLNRKWFSPPGSGLWFSYLIRKSIKANSAARITMLAAATTAHALKEYTGFPIELHWPNDIFLDGKKLCGVLSEGLLEKDRLIAVVVGTGLNINISRDEFPEEIRDIAISLKSYSGKTFDRVAIMKLLLQRISESFSKPGWESGEPGLSLWMSLFKSRGREVDVDGIRGIIKGVDKDGVLILTSQEGKIIRIVSGDVILKDG